MRKLSLVVATLVFVAYASPDQAMCQNPRIVSSAFPAGQWSYVLTPGVEPGPTSTSVSPDLVGRFWALGAGQPAQSLGADSGSFPALHTEGRGWIRPELGYAVTFHTTWAADNGIDGCIDDVASENKCTAVLLSDQHQGRGYFAVLTAAPVIGNYAFAQPENAPITLAAVPPPQLLGESVALPDGVRASVRVGNAPSGVFVGSPACGSGLVSGYRVYAQTVARGAPAPASRRRAGAGWSLAEGGWGAGGAPLPLEQQTDVTVHCTGSADVYLAASLVFDSGFETEYLSESPSPVQCAP